VPQKTKCKRERAAEILKAFSIQAMKFTPPSNRIFSYTRNREAEKYCSPILKLSCKAYV
jgi:hypothetical protein